MRVTAIHAVIQRTLNEQTECGLLGWPPNIPSSEVWIEFIEDKGGASTKLLVKFICCKDPNSVYRTVLLGMLDRVSDNYTFLEKAFGPLYEQIAQLSRGGKCVRSIWRQQLPVTISRRDDDDRPVRDRRDIKIIQQKIKAAAKQKIRDEHCADAWRKPALPAPKKPRVLSLQHHAAPAAPLAIATPTTTKAVTSRPTFNSEPLPLICLPITQPEDPNVPPEDLRPDCAICAWPDAKLRSGRFPGVREVTGCACAKREAKATNGSGPARPKLSHHVQESPRLKGCTWSSQCKDCQATGSNGEDMELQALVRQWLECNQRGLAVRRLRVFFGGDMLSQCEPCGHAGPNSKYFCLMCLAILNETNAAGVPHLRTPPAGTDDTRSARAADPPARAGSASFQFQATKFAAAQKLHEQKGVKQPEMKDFDSVTRNPLIHFDGPPHHSLSLVPLHLFLGLALEQVNLLEAQLQELDALWASHKGRVLADAKVQAKLLETRDKVEALKAELVQLAATADACTAAMEHIEESDLGAEIVKRVKKSDGTLKPRSKAVAYVPLDREDEYRKHLTELIAANTSIKQASAALKRSSAELLKLYSTEAGPFVRAFYTLMDSFNLQRQAYHSSALNGNDCHKIFRPHVSKQFAQLLAPRLTCELDVETVDGEATVRLSLKNVNGIGDSKRAEDVGSLWLTLGEAASLWTRKEPLCEHEIHRFEDLAEQLAVDYARVYPGKQPLPKLHWLCYHVSEQMNWLGTSGMLHEGVVEALHVVDNRHVLRFSHVKNAEAFVLMRARAMWQQQCPRAINVRAMDQQRSNATRDRRNACIRSEWEKARTARLEHRDNN